MEQPSPVAASRRRLFHPRGTLAVARIGVVHAFGTGRHKGVPYIARVEMRGSFGTGRDKPVPTVFCSLRVRAPDSGCILLGALVTFAPPRP